MAFDTEGLKSILDNADVSVDDKITQILSEHEADIKGLKLKNSELIGSEKKLKESISGYETEKGNFEKQIADLTEQIKSKSDDKTKEFYEAKLKDAEKASLEKYEALMKERNDLYGYKLNLLKQNAVNKGIEGIRFVDDNLKRGFINTVMAENQFDPEEIDGQTVFLNKDHKTIEDVIKAYALSNEGKSFIAYGNSGGGATGSQTSGGGYAGNNPFDKAHPNLDKQMEIYRTNKPLAERLMREAGVSF